MDIIRNTLKNGLRVVLVPRADATAATVMVAFKAGSRDETDHESGISHFLEHMAYKGTKKRPTSKEIAEFIENLGAVHNAFTAKDHTGYYVKIAPSHLADAFDFLSDVVINSIVPEKEVEKERMVILEELKMYEDIPMYLAAEEYEKSVHQDKDLARIIIGTRETISKMSREMILNYRKSHYTAPNAVLVVAGNFGGNSKEKMLEMTEKYFVLPEQSEKVADNPRQKDIRRVKTISKKTEQTNLVFGFPSIGILDEDYHAVRLLAKILGGSMSSRMYRHVREDLGLAYEIETGYSGYVGEGYIATYAGVANDKACKAIEAILTEYRAICDTEISNEELARAKEIIKGKLLIDAEDSGEIAHDFIYDELMQGAIITYEQKLKKFNSVTKSDIKRVAKRFLVPDKIVITAVGPNISESQILSQIK